MFEDGSRRGETEAAAAAAATTTTTTTAATTTTTTATTAAAAAAAAAAATPRHPHVFGCSPSPPSAPLTSSPSSASFC